MKPILCLAVSTQPAACTLPRAADGALLEPLPNQRQQNCLGGKTDFRKMLMPEEQLVEQAKQE
jgi:hypothetical protein